MLAAPPAVPEQLAYAQHAIHVYDAARSVDRTVTHPAPGATDGQPAWSPDGKQISFVRTVGKRQTLLIVTVRNRSVRRATTSFVEPRDEAVAVRGPVRAPDGRSYLVVRGDSHSNGQLVLVDRRGRHARLTEDVPVDPEVHFSDGYPSWSADGRHVAFVRGPYTGDAFVVDSNGRGERRLTWSGRAQQPLLSADGRYLSFVDGRILYVVGTRERSAHRVASQSGPGAWRPDPRLRVAVPLAASVRPRERRLQLEPEYLGSGTQRLVDVRLFSNRVPGDLTDISADGRLVSFVAYTGRSSRDVGVIDLAARRIRTLVHGATDWVADLSPDGRWVLFHRGWTLFAASTVTGAAVRVSSSHPGRAFWLTDGRVELAQGHRLFTAFPGGPLQPTGYRLPARAIDVSVSPDGHHVVYALGCRVWLADLAARTRRIVDRRKVFDTGDWSSDGRHFLLRQGWWANGCRQFEVALWGGISVRDLGGRELGGAQGGATWSADGKLALAFGGVSGTAVTYMQPMSVISTTTGRQGLLLPNRIEGVPLAGPGGWILYARYDPTKLRPDEAPLVSARLYLARLIPRWRR